MKERESFEKCHAVPLGLDIEYIEDESGGFYSDREVHFMYEGFKAGASYAAQGQYLRPMSTAPKDGTQIIVVGPDNDKRWAVCWDDYNKNWPTHNSWFEEDEPIGWIPIEDYASPMPRVPEGKVLVDRGWLLETQQTLAKIYAAVASQSGAVFAIHKGIESMLSTAKEGGK